LIIAVEGENDRGVVGTFLNKLGMYADILLMRGNRPTKIANKIIAKAEKHINKDAKIEKIIVLKDLHGYKEKIIEEHLKTIEQKSTTTSKIS